MYPSAFSKLSVSRNFFCGFASLPSDIPYDSFSIVEMTRTTNLLRAVMHRKTEPSFTGTAQHEFFVAFKHVGTFATIFATNDRFGGGR